MTGLAGKAIRAGVLALAAAFVIGLAPAAAHAGTCTNDALACAQVLPNTPGNAAIAVTVGAGSEQDETAHAGFGPVRSVWYAWTAPSSGDFTAETCGTPNSAMDTVLGVYANGASHPLTEIASGDDNCGQSGLQSRAHFTATAGTEYRVAVDSKVPGSAKLTIDKAPANDDLAAPQDLGCCLPITLNGASNLAATKQAGEANHAPGNAGGASVWFRWTAPPTPANGFVVVDTCGTNGQDPLNTLLAVYADGAAFPLTQLAANDNACGQQSRVVLATTANTSYLIAVDGSASGVIAPPDQGDFDLDINARPANDDFAQAQSISGALPQDAIGTTVGATGEPPDEPSHAGVPAFASVWYSWQPQVEGDVAIDTCDSAFDTRLAVYTGSTLDDLAEVDSNSDACGTGGTRSRVAFHADPNQTYRIAVDTSDAPGAVDLDIAEADLTDPQVSVDDLVVNKRKGKAKFFFSGTDNETSPETLEFTCRIDNKPEEPCTSPKSYKKVKRGKHEFRVFATDEAGNDSAVFLQKFKSRRKP
jgi:hypothetical protein